MQRAASGAGGEGTSQAVQAGIAAAPRGVSWWLSTCGSAIALVVSGVSLWETVLKQPSLKVYVGESVNYTRDPWGSYEVFVVPVTITNSGAQDGAVMSIRLELTNVETGHKDTLTSAYTADASWFSGQDNVTTRSKRPKSPFSPIAIAGRSAWSGTILFYSSDFRERRLADPRSRLTGNVVVLAPASDGWLDRTFSQPLRAIPITLDVPNFLPGALLSGDTARVKVALGDTAAAAAAAPMPPAPTASGQRTFSPGAAVQGTGGPASPGQATPGTAAGGGPVPPPPK